LSQVPLLGLIFAFARMALLRAGRDIDRKMLEKEEKEVNGSKSLSLVKCYFL